MMKAYTRKQLEHAKHERYNYRYVSRMCERSGDRSGRWMEVTANSSNIVSPDGVDTAVKIMEATGYAASILEYVGPSPAKTTAQKAAVKGVSVATTILKESITFELPSPIEIGDYAREIRDAMTEGRCFAWVQIQCVECKPKPVDSRKFLMWENTGQKKWVFLDNLNWGAGPGKMRDNYGLNKKKREESISKAVAEKIKTACDACAGE